MPVNGAALLPVSPEDNYLNQIMCVISVSSDVSSRHHRKSFRTREQLFLLSGIF